MVQIKLDCKLVVENFMGSSNNQFDFGNILFNCISLLEHFSNYTINIAKIQTNNVAHTVAQISKLYTRHHYLI